VAIADIQGKLGQGPIVARPVLALDGQGAVKVTVRPQRPGIEHIILAVKDDGNPSLTSYRRIIITVNK